MKQFKYKTSFASSVRCLIDEEKDKFLAEASLSNLKKLIPNNLNEQADLLCIAFNAFTPNLANKNFDLIDTKTALEIYKSFINKPINIEHTRDNGAIGHIVSAGLSKFDINYSNNIGSELIEASTVKDKSLPFNVSLSAVLYRLYASKLIDFIEESNNPDSENFMQVSASWELMFDTYNIAVGSKYLDKCEIIEAGSEDFEKYDKYLMCNDGSGKTPDGKPVYRLVTGEVLPAGIGLTENPAGDVKGLVIASQLNEETKASFVCPECGEELNLSDKKYYYLEDLEDTEEDEEIECAKCKKSSAYKNWKSKVNLNNSENSISQIEKEDVKNNTTITSSTTNTKNNMIKTIKDITDENLKEAKAADISKIVDDEVAKINEKYKSDKEKLDSELKASSDKQTELEKTVKETNDKLAKATEDLQMLIKANEDREKEETFTARMTYFDAEYELDEKSRNSVAKRIKGLDEEAYKAEKEDLEVLLAAKKKGFVPFKKKGEVEDSPEDKKEDKKEKEAKASVEDKEEKKTDAVSDAIDKGEKKEVAAAATTTVKETEADKWNRNFGIENWELDARKMGNKK
jgi:hypothetical protein